MFDGNVNIKIGGHLKKLLHFLPLLGRQSPNGDFYKYITLLERNLIQVIS